MGKNKRFHDGSIRLQNWDYSTPGFYAVSISIKNKESLLGEIHDGQFRGNQFADIVEKFWLDLPNHYSNIKLDEFQMMPDHVHFILEIKGVDWARLPLMIFQTEQRPKPEKCPERKYRRQKMLLFKIMGRFKMQSAKEINLLRGTQGQRMWQGDYYETLMRNPHHLETMRVYIRNNPKNWRT
jgi:REP element-mobilizing transposase RayT